MGLFLDILIMSLAWNFFVEYQNTKSCRISSNTVLVWWGGGGGEVLQYQMDAGVRLTLQMAMAFGENTVSKNEESFDEKPNFGSNLGGIG